MRDACGRRTRGTDHLSTSSGGKAPAGTRDTCGGSTELRDRLCGPPPGSLTEGAPFSALVTSALGGEVLQHWIVICWASADRRLSRGEMRCLRAAALFGPQMPSRLLLLVPRGPSAFQTRLRPWNHPLGCLKWHPQRAVSLPGCWVGGGVALMAALLEALTGAPRRAAAAKVTGSRSPWALQRHQSSPTASPGQGSLAPRENEKSRGAKVTKRQPSWDRPLSPQQPAPPLRVHQRQSPKVRQRRGGGRSRAPVPPRPEAHRRPLAASPPVGTRLPLSPRATCQWPKDRKTLLQRGVEVWIPPKGLFIHGPTLGCRWKVPRITS